MRRSLGISEPEAPRLEVSRMRRRHLRGVMAIERQVYPRPWSPNLFLSEMTESKNRCYLVARIDREVVGYAGMICYGEEAHITNIAIDPLHHRQKIATRLLHDLIGQAVEMGAEAVSLEVRVTNWGAQRLYGERSALRHREALVQRPRGGHRTRSRRGEPLRRHHQARFDQTTLGSDTPGTDHEEPAR